MDTFLPAGSFVGFMVPDAIDGSLCNSLLENVQARGFSATGLRYPDDYRNNDRLVFDDPSLAAQLFAALRKDLPPELVVDGRTWMLEGLNPRFRACRYQDGQGFCVHRDGSHVPSAQLRSLLTVQLYLDDVPSRFGGYTRFYADARGATTLASIRPVAGAAIVFDHRVWHDGEVVRGGVKHVLRTDAMYRRVGREREADDTLGRHRGYVWKVIMRANGDIASAGRDGTVRMRGARPQVIDLGLGSVTALHETAGRLWAGTRSGRLVLLDEEGGFRQVAAINGAVLDLGHLPGGLLVASTASGTLYAFDELGEVRWTSQAHEGWAWQVAPYREGLVSVGQDGRIGLTTTRGQTSTIGELGRPLRAVATRGEELWLGDTHGTLHMLEAGVLRLSLEAHDAAITSIVIAKDGIVVTGSEDGAVKRWRDRVSEPCALRSDFVTSVAMNPQGDLVCAGYDGDIFRA